MLDKTADFIALIKDCKSKNICLSSFAALYLLSVGKATYPSDLCIEMGLRPAQATRMLAKLRLNNLVSDKIDGMDRRRVAITITGDGVRWLRSAILDLNLKV